jgi:hypothetical protein
MAKVLQLVNRPESTLALLKIDGQAIPVSLLDGPAGAPVVAAVLQGNIFIDPQNSTGNASDANPGTATAPFLTYAGVVKVWGTTKPLLNVATTLTWLSNGAAAVDPVVFEPYVMGNVKVGIQGAAPTVLATAVLAGTVAKNRTLGSNSALISTLAAAAAPGSLLINTTHPSRAWVQRGLGANSFQITQPLVAADGQGVVTAPAEVDTWADGDNVQIASLVNIPLVRYAPTFLDNQGGGSAAFLYQARIVSVGGAARCTLDGTGGAIHGQETLFANRSLLLAADIIGITNTLTNCFEADFHGMRGTANYLGGALNSFSVLDGVGVLDGDIIVGSNTTLRGAGWQLGFVFNDVSSLLTVIGSGAGTIGSAFYGGATLYSNAGGTGELRMANSSRLVKAASTWVAQVTNPTMVTGIALNGVRTGVSHTGAAPDVFNGGIATTPANLDAAAGAAGFGGNALSMQIGGASTSTQQ